MYILFVGTLRMFRSKAEKKWEEVTDGSNIERKVDPNITSKKAD